MTYGNAREILMTLKEKQYDRETVLAAIRKIQDMSTINAIYKETLMDVIEWLIHQMEG